MEQKVLLVKTDYNKGFILDMPLADAVAIIDLMKPVDIISGSVMEATNKDFEFIIHTKKVKED
jgi:hypothetical protein